MARILVVEDSPTVVSAVERLLRQNAHKVYVARDGLTALASMRAFVPELTLLDILLPHVDGFQLCAMIRQHPVHNSMPIIMMSCLKDQADIQRAYDAGADAYITKPFTDDELITTVEHYLGRIRTSLSDPSGGPVPERDGGTH